MFALLSHPTESLICI